MTSMNCSPPRAIDAEQAGRVAGRERPDLEQAHLEHRLGDLRLEDAERDSITTPPISPPMIQGLVHPVGCPP
jgi:hypothetical protein